MMAKVSNASFERDWSYVLDDVHYLSGLLGREGDDNFTWRVGELYKDDHMLDLDNIGFRATTKTHYAKGRVVILGSIGHDLLREPSAILYINKIVNEELESFLAEQ
jgi:hypothetical protein